MLIGPPNALRRTAALLALLAATAAACGVRATDVPVDGGPAPTRATCDAPVEDAAPTTPTVEDTEVYLVCGSHVNPVQRTIDLPLDDNDRVDVAKALLAELQTDPAHGELVAGFTSEVPADLEVSGPTGDDPPVVLRLNKRPSDLTASALVQIICTFASNEPLGDGQSVMLGGPADSPSAQPKSYACTTAMRTSPDAARGSVGWKP